MKRSYLPLLLAILLILSGGCASGTQSAGDKITPTPSAAPDGSASNTPQSDTQSPAAETETPSEPQGYPFEAYGQTVLVCAEAAPLLAAFPEPDSVFESKSCAFEGVDITYFYPGFELTTYPGEGGERVLTVALTDDSVNTPEGVYIGGSADSIIRAYGEGYTQEGDVYVYTQGKGSLTFGLADGAIISILYAYDV